MDTVNHSLLPVKFELTYLIGKKAFASIKVDLTVNGL